MEPLVSTPASSLLLLYLPPLYPAPISASSALTAALFTPRLGTMAHFQRKAGKKEELSVTELPVC